MIHQGVAIAEEHVGDALLLGKLPHALLIVQVRRVLGKPSDAYVLPDVRMIQEGGGLLRRVDGAVVQCQDDPLSGPSSPQQQPSHEENELRAVLSSLGDSRHQGAMLPGRVVDGPERSDFGVLTRRRDVHLLASPHPGASQVRVKMEVGLVLEPEFVAGSRA